MSKFQVFAPMTQGRCGSAPKHFNAVTTDNLATVTGAGYMNDMSKIVKLNDIIDLNYADTSTFPLGEASTFGIFRVTSPSAGVLSLVQTVTTS